MRTSSLFFAFAMLFSFVHVASAQDDETYKLELPASLFDDINDDEFENIQRFIQGQIVTPLGGGSFCIGCRDVEIVKVEDPARAEALRSSPLVDGKAVERNFLCKAACASAAAAAAAGCTAYTAGVGLTICLAAATAAADECRSNC